jgi:hypothetical protein
MGSHILSIGWNNWGNPENEKRYYMPNINLQAKVQTLPKELLGVVS